MRAGSTHSSSKMMNETTGTVFTSFIGGSRSISANRLNRQMIARTTPSTRAIAKPVTICFRLPSSIPENSGFAISSRSAAHTSFGYGRSTGLFIFPALYCHRATQTAREIRRYSGIRQRESTCRRRERPSVEGFDCPSLLFLMENPFRPRRGPPKRATARLTRRAVTVYFIFVHLSSSQIDFVYDIRHLRELGTISIL